MRKTRVYVAGPLTKGNVALNVSNAVEAGDILYNAGYAPYIPHLNHFWDMLYSKDYEDWMELDIQWLLTCDVLLRLPGESPGGDREVKVAREAGIPVYFNMKELRAFETPMRSDNER